MRSTLCFMWMAFVAGFASAQGQPPEPSPVPMDNATTKAVSLLWSSSAVLSGCWVPEHGSVISMAAEMQDDIGQTVAVSVSFNTKTRCYVLSPAFDKDCRTIDSKCSVSGTVVLKPQYEQSVRPFEAKFVPPFAIVGNQRCPEVPAQVMFSACESGGDVIDESQLAIGINENEVEGRVFAGIREQ